MCLPSCLGSGVSSSRWPFFDSSSSSSGVPMLVGSDTIGERLGGALHCICKRRRRERRASAAAVKHTTRTLSGPPSASIAMDGAIVRAKQRTASSVRAARVPLRSTVRVVSRSLQAVPTLTLTMSIVMSYPLAHTAERSPSSPLALCGLPLPFQSSPAPVSRPAHPSCLAPCTRPAHPSCLAPCKSLFLAPDSNTSRAHIRRDGAKDAPPPRCRVVWTCGGEAF
jgi:hypothetical protein